ncbi:MAG: serine/threonine-protein kinase, partial [Actinomycetota bacterium]
MLGQVLDRYRLVERLGEGEAGELFKGQHPTLDQCRAVKVLPRRLSQDPEQVARLVREARRCAVLNHPNIVRLEHLGEQEGRYYVVTDYVPGHSLRELIDAHGPLPAERAIRVARQICAALAYAHEQGIVHGDIKPSSILVGQDDHAMLADFGACWR